VHLEGISRLTAQLSPQRTLERGFSITRDEQGRLLRDSKKIQTGERMHTQLTDGEITSRVEPP
jgi:exodeoxyribonuclease VII large subunit